jgi:hypothetical protein
VRAKGLLSDNIDRLHKLAEVLLEKEVLDGEEIDDVIFGDNHPGDGILLAKDIAKPKQKVEEPKKEADETVTDAVNPPLGGPGSIDPVGIRKDGSGENKENAKKGKPGHLNGAKT